VSSANDQFLETLRIRSVLERYCSLLDSGAVTELLELFDEDCVFTMMGQTFTGKSEFAAVWQTMVPTERPTTLHTLANPDIVVTGDDATAVSGWVMFDRSGPGGATQAVLAGRYHDALRRYGNGLWRFTHRRVESLGRPVRPPAQSAAQQVGVRT
jgi:ketosteroid isomerase-like protein